jgi:hypothetical protein
MTDPLRQYLLPSGRGVRLRELTYDQVDAVEAQVAGSDKLQTGQGIVSRMQFSRLVSAECVALMVAEMTEEKGIAFEKLAEAKWRKCEPSMFDGKLSEFFSAKDMVVLRNRYAVEHDVSDIELAGVLEKKADVLPG